MNNTTLQDFKRALRGAPVRLPQHQRALRKHLLALYQGRSPGCLWLPGHAMRLRRAALGKSPALMLFVAAASALVLCTFILAVAT